jgi:hypothetical protein
MAVWAVLSKANGVLVEDWSRLFELWDTINMLVVGITKSLAMAMAKAFMTYNFGDTSIVEMVEKRVMGTWAGQGHHQQTFAR